MLRKIADTAKWLWDGEYPAVLAFAAMVTFWLAGGVKKYGDSLVMAALVAGSPLAYRPLIRIGRVAFRWLGSKTSWLAPKTFKGVVFLIAVLTGGVGWAVGTWGPQHPYDPAGFASFMLITLVVLLALVMEAERLDSFVSRMWKLLGPTYFSVFEEELDSYPKTSHPGFDLVSLSRRLGELEAEVVKLRAMSEGTRAPAKAE